MFDEWETFYLLVGTSAGALVGVMFVVITLTAEVAADEINRGTTIYQTPTVFHLAVIVAISAMALLPHHLAGFAGGCLMLIGVAGLAYALLTTMRTFERYEFYQATLADRVFFGLLPSLLYLALGAGGVMVFLAPEIAAEAIAAATMLLLLVAVRNAWDLATFSVRMARAHGTKTPATK